MKFYARVPWMTAALAAALLAANATAADPKEKDAKDKEAPAKVDKDVEAWINVLTAKIADRHDSIRESARHALIALGKPALPALQKLVDGSDGAAAEAAQHVIARIEGSHDGRPGPFGPRGFWGEMGPQRRGFPMGSPPPHPGAGGPPGGGPRPDGPGHPGFGPPPGQPGGSGGFGPPGAGPGSPRFGGAAGGFGPRPGGAAGPGGPPGMGGGGGGGPGAMIERAMKELTLTDAQKTKLQEVVKAQGEKAREAMQKMHEDFLDAIKGAIGEEEYKKLEKILPKPPAPGDNPGAPDKPKPSKE
jgi:hypothetical protein